MLKRQIQTGLMNNFFALFFAKRPSMLMICTAINKTGLELISVMCQQKVLTQRSHLAGTLDNQYNLKCVLLVECLYHSTMFYMNCLFNILCTYFDSWVKKCQSLFRTRIQGVLYQLVQCQLRLINGQQMRTQVATSIILNGSLT